MRLLWRLIHDQRLPGQGRRQRWASCHPSRRQRLTQPTPWVGCWLVLLLCMPCEVSTVLGAETPRLSRRSPLPQAPAPGPAPALDLLLHPAPRHAALRAVQQVRRAAARLPPSPPGGPDSLRVMIPPPDGFRRRELRLLKAKRPAQAGRPSAIRQVGG